MLKTWLFLCLYISLYLSYGGLRLVAVTLEGLVLRDDTGAVLASAEVRVAREGQAYLEAHRETDREGRFRAEDLPEGRYTLTVAKPGYFDTAVDVDTTVAVPAGAGNFSVRLIRTASIAGQARWRDGSPISGARVYLMERAQSGNLQRPRRGGTGSVQTKQDGSFRLHSLAPGNYVLAMNYRSGEQSGGTLYPDSAHPQVFAIKGGEDIRDRDFIADAEGSFAVAGKVEATGLLATALPTAASAKSAENRPPTYAVGIAPVGQPGILIAWTRTDPDGSFRLPAVPSGEYLVFGAGPAVGYNGLEGVLADKAPLVFGTERIALHSAAENVRVSLTEARRAVLRLDASVQGREGCPGSLELRVRSVEAWGSDLTRTVTLSVGKPQEIDNLAPARYEFALARASEGCGLASTKVLDLRDGSPQEPFVLTVGGKGSIVGRVVDADGTTSLEAVLVPIGGVAARQIAVHRVDTDGQFRIADLPPGLYGLSLRVSKGDRGTPLLADAASVVEVEVLGGEVEILLNAPAGATASSK